MSSVGCVGSSHAGAMASMVCRSCATLFDRRAAAAPVHGRAGTGVAAGKSRWASGHYRLVPDRRLRIEDLELSDAMWEELRLPVDNAFFFRHDSIAARGIDGDGVHLVFVSFEQELKSGAVALLAGFDNPSINKLFSHHH